ALALTAMAFWITATSVGSDMLYVGLGAWWLAELVAYARGGEGWRLWTSAALGALAMLTRWVGFTLGIAGALWLGLRLLRRREWRELWRPFAYGMLVVGPTMVLQLFNPIGSGEAALRSSPGQALALETLHDIARTVAADLGLWPVPGFGPALALFVLRWLALGVLACMVVRSFLPGRKERDAGLLALVLPGGAYVAVYVAVVAYTRSIQYVPDISTRYVNPVYPVVFAALGVCAVKLLSWARRRGRAVAIPLITLALVFAAVPQWTGMPLAARTMRAGVGLSAARWREGEGFELVRRLAPEAVISPTAAYVYVLTGVPSRPPGAGWDAKDIAQACAEPPLRDLDVLILVADPDSAWVHDTVDVEGLLNPVRFEVLLHTPGELVVRPRR
ncbi:MAG: hypothetical protein U1F44_04230, partial [Coriobacteriia bacterium]|nr:hypothetical protein [Coriobacteriia bacterium]